ncbi:putative protein kinase RLK-Pelle-DLSV family [Helianthus annuus]|uniref:Serine-threonine/tyrosine-protein kinase catalytic domain-containing protein n=1 Tax=Helianthus annuus TaxID=4232 RepID=A0A9K3HDZ1_HELAN|nr:putative protein kinase RLK-Pelle-DLSV family [Helianthus annuus]KAJ0478203.1 putative protein kinase RLK-Pelle-DLSV family [Helianthus annuus]KAJ0482904.1 putative protein kinase RLK-Pelle-DLSV family [Helianthus annuus]KAJ0499087.1 putative protein kinase RLK-Pelle-DLSV family [Helianthus annuus]KAJ0665101.1 putative protein kinase RLK-Pelle-DLSV family [Helianthus annuus]
MCESIKGTLINLFYTHSAKGLYFLDSGYISPEYIWYRRFSSQSDVCSFGVLILEVIACQKNVPLCDDARSQMLHNLVRIHFPL